MERCGRLSQRTRNGVPGLDPVGNVDSWSGREFPSTGLKGQRMEASGASNPNVGKADLLMAVVVGFGSRCAGVSERIRVRAHGEFTIEPRWSGHGACERQAARSQPRGRSGRRIALI